MTIRQSIGVVVLLILLCDIHPLGLSQQARFVGTMTAESAQPPEVTLGPPPKEFVPDPLKHPTVDLWPDGAPGLKNKKANIEAYRIERSSGSYADDILVISQVHFPSLTIFLPPKKIATGAAIIVAPGGGFRELWITSEGYRVAAWLSQQGIAAFVLKYRLPKDTGSTYTIDDSLADMQRAIRIVKSRGAEWEVDPNRVGIMGFSAGSMLSGIAGQRFDDRVTKPVDAIDQLSAKPAFVALIYGSPFTSIRGGKPLVEGVRKDTPPTFLLCGGNDPISANYPQTYQMLRDAGVPVELHIYDGIGHGFGIQPGNPRSISEWPERLYDWLLDLGFLTKAE